MTPEWMSNHQRFPALCPVDTAHVLRLADEVKILSSVERVLFEAEVELMAMTMAIERAAHAGWPRPRTPCEFLTWFEDEAYGQELVGKSEVKGEARQERIKYAAALRAVASRLKSLGLRPAFLSQVNLSRHQVHVINIG